MNDSHPGRPDLRRRSVTQVIEERTNAVTAECFRQLLSRTREAAVAADFVQRVAVRILITAVADQVQFTDSLYLDTPMQVEVNSLRSH